MIFLLISCRLVKQSCMTNKIFVIFGRKKCSNFSCLDHDFLYLLLSIKMGTNCCKNIFIKIPKFYCIVISYEIKNKYILTLLINLVCYVSKISVPKLKKNMFSLKKFMLTYKLLGENFPFIAQLCKTLLRDS